MKDKNRVLQKFCIMPWVHLHVDTDGMVKACCSTSVTYGNIRSNDVPAIWEGDQIEAFRLQIKADGVDRRCNACLKREAVGKSSMRIETNAKYSGLVDRVEKGDEVFIKPKYLDIRFSNLCNLRCRTCWHGASSSWFEESKRLKNNFGEKAIIRVTHDNISLLDELFAYATKVDEIYFAGGEPLMMEEHYYTLDQLIANEQKDVKLRYNTNLSQLTLKNKSIIDYWKQFDHVKVLASIDTMGDQLAYVRKGISWDRLLENVKKIRNEVLHIQLEIAPTVSIFNIMKLSDMHRFFFEAGLIPMDAFYLNLLQRPFEYNIKTMTYDLKSKASAMLEDHVIWLKENSASEFTINEYRSIIDFMNADTLDNYRERFRKQTETLDNWRGESFEKVFPELKPLL